MFIISGLCEISPREQKSIILDVEESRGSRKYFFFFFVFNKNLICHGNKKIRLFPRDDSVDWSRVAPLTQQVWVEKKLFKVV